MTVKKSNVFPEPHRAAAMADFIAVSRTLVYTVRPQTGASELVPLYSRAFAGTDSQAELTRVAGYELPCNGPCCLCENLCLLLFQYYHFFTSRQLTVAELSK